MSSVSLMFTAGLPCSQNPPLLSLTSTLPPFSPSFIFLSLFVIYSLHSLWLSLLLLSLPLLPFCPHLLLYLSLSKYKTNWNAQSPAVLVLSFSSTEWILTRLKIIISKEHDQQRLIIFCSLLLTTLFTLILTQLPVLKTEEFAVMYHHRDSQGFLISSGLLCWFKEADGRSEFSH